MKKYRIKISSPTLTRWVTKSACSEDVAKSMAIGNAGGRLGWYVSECVEIKEAM